MSEGRTFFKGTLRDDNLLAWEFVVGEDGVPVQISTKGGANTHIYHYGQWQDSRTAFAPYMTRIVESQATYAVASRFAQGSVDFAGAVGGGLSTVFGAALNGIDKYKGAFSTASRGLGYAGMGISLATNTYAIATNQAQMSHYVDWGITAVLIGITLVNPPLGLGLATGYGAGRLIVGSALDNLVNAQYNYLIINR